MSSRTLKTITLGCKVNQYETEYVRQGLARLGFREPADGEPADLCVVNTCTVTAEADRKSRRAIRRMARENPHAEIIVMGCYAARAPAEAAAMPGVVDVVTDKRRLPELLERLGLADVPTGISSFGRRHRAFVKVQDGCTMQCSYCIIPKTRPVPSSRPVRNVLDEIERLVRHGHREIVLTGIHLGHYGLDLTEFEACRRRLLSPTEAPSVVSRRQESPPTNTKRPDLAGLVRRIVELDGEFRVRVSSIEAAEATPELIAVMADRPDRVCPHLHLSMQSGSDAVLRRMRRRGTVRQFLDQCRLARESLDHAALTTDVIVGFPGETDADFEATCRAMEEAGFSKIHIFRFSARQGTSAATMPDQVPEPIRRDRAARLARIEKRLRQRYFESLAGLPLQVLVERPMDESPGMLLGTSARYTPVELPACPAEGDWATAGGDWVTHRLGQLARVIAGPVVNGRIRAVAQPPPAV
jgi:threonylcarbamoyladenosine tRNA methylthiotransferase MtaB